MNTDRTFWWLKRVPLKRRACKLFSKTTRFCVTDWILLSPKIRIRFIIIDGNLTKMPHRPFSYSNKFIGALVAPMPSMWSCRWALFYQIVKSAGQASQVESRKCLTLVYVQKIIKHKLIIRAHSGHCIRLKEQQNMSYLSLRT